MILPEVPHGIVLAGGSWLCWSCARELSAEAGRPLTGIGATVWNADTAHVCIACDTPHGPVMLDDATLARWRAEEEEAR